MFQWRSKTWQWIKFYCLLPLDSAILCYRNISVGSAIPSLTMWIYYISLLFPPPKRKIFVAFCGLWLWLQYNTFESLFGFFGQLNLNLNTNKYVFLENLALIYGWGSLQGQNLFMDFFHLNKEYNCLWWIGNKFYFP